MTEHLLTFAEAEKVSAYTLARNWADSIRPTEREIDPDVELAELATMMALRAWLVRWEGTQIHRALASGATVEQVQAAAGHVDPEQVVKVWREWDEGQRRLWEIMPELAREEQHLQISEALTEWEAKR